MFSFSEYVSVKISPIHCVWTEISANYIFVVFDCPRLYVLFSKVPVGEGVALTADGFRDALQPEAD